MVETEDLALAAGGIGALYFLSSRSGGSDGPQFPNITIPGGGGSTPIPIPSGGSGGPSLEGIGSILGAVNQPNQGISQFRDILENQSDQFSTLFTNQNEAITNLQEQMQNLQNQDQILPDGEGDIIDPTDIIPGTEGFDIDPRNYVPSGGSGGNGGNIISDTTDLISESVGVVEGGSNFVSENPYFTLLTGAGAISPDPITTGMGAAAGAVTEVTSDFLTGGTPLGQQSPADYLDPDTYTNFGSQIVDGTKGLADFMEPVNMFDPRDTQSPSGPIDYSGIVDPVGDIAQGGLGAAKILTDNLPEENGGSLTIGAGGSYGPNI